MSALIVSLALLAGGAHTGPTSFREGQVVPAPGVSLRDLSRQPHMPAGAASREPPRFSLQRPPLRHAFRPARSRAHVIFMTTLAGFVGGLALGYAMDPECGWSLGAPIGAVAGAVVGIQVTK